MINAISYSDDTLDDSLGQIPSGYQNPSRFAENLILLMWLILLVEGLFTPYLRGAFGEGGAWWTRITPWDLFPSELIFYNPLTALIGLYIITRGRTYGHKTTRGLWMLVLIFCWGIYGALNGLLSGAPGNFWLADLRQTVLGAWIVPVICSLAPRVRLSVLLRRFYKAGMLMAIYNGTIGIMTFAGLIYEDSRFQIGWYSEYILIFMYIAILSQKVITDKGTFLSLFIISYGIIAPFHKPTIGVFVLANFFVLIFFVISSRKLGLKVYLRTFKVATMLAVGAALLMSYMFTLGNDALREWINRKYLKLQVSAGSRDLSGRRFAAWGWGIDQWKSHPFKGTGFGIWLVTYEGEGEGDVRYVPIHNLLIETLYETGVFALILWSCVIFWLARIYKYLKVCSDDYDYWAILAMYCWVLTMIAMSGAGRYLGAVNIQLTFFICVGLLTNAEAQYHTALSYGSYIYEENNLSEEGTLKH
ncbi:MAG: O-antigen ligase family protein [Planctomycetota bacterium]